MLTKQAYISILKLVGTLLIILMMKSATAQYYSTGQEPASIRWRQLHAENVRLIFPYYYEANARKLASYLDSTYNYASRSLDFKPKKISLVLHTQSSTSNALVVWAPKRMEFYTTPPQDMYAQPWMEQLAIHEYRHVVQVDKLNQGPTKVLSWIFGQQGTGAVLGLYIPPWFLEGDAVVAETGLSRSGRGRSPLFEMKLRAQILEIGIYSYDKAVLGSYRDFTPGAYELGYFIVTEGRRKYGAELWSHSLDVIARRPYMVTPFQKGIRDITGLRKREFYKECMESLQTEWSMQDQATEKHLTGQLSRQNKHYTNYRHPILLEDGKILSLKTSIDDIPRLVVIDEWPKEKVIYTPGFLKDETLSYAKNKICWVETRPDIRWANRSYTVIRIFDVESGRSKTLNLGLRVFAPAFSDDASHVVAVHSDSLDRYSLLIIDVEGGKVTNKFPSPQNAFPLTPVWAGEDHIITVLVSEAGKSIAKINVETGETSYLTEWDYADISQPVYHPPYVYFTAPYSGISNIYALSLEDGGIRKVTFSQYGAVDPFISEDGESLLYTDYSADGSHIVNLPLKGGSRTPLEKVFDKSIGLYRTLEEQEEIVPDWSDVPESKAPSKKYSKLANLFNFHSWAPLAIDATNYTVNPGVSIMSQNLLSSSFFSAGYQYNLNEEAGKVYASYSYQGWYPIIDVYVDYGLRKDFVTHPIETEIKWNETNISTGLRLPLNLRRGKYYAGITPSVYINQIFRKMKPGSLLEFRKANIASGSYGVRLYRQIKSSVRDIYPQWGQSIDLYYYDTPFESDIYSSLLAAITSLYFPGIINHHGINLYGGYQYRLIGDYKFSDRVSYPRGITGKQDEQLYSFRGTYAFPIAYPDWSIGPVIYMKRIRGALFYDYAVGENPGHTNYYNSMGADLITEVHLLRFLAPFEFGVRSIYLPDENSVVWEFLFGVGF